MPDGAILSVRNLTVEYATQSAAVRAVDGVDLELHPGGFLGIVGESGSGKSTLLFAIAQLLSPPAEIVSGEVYFNGRDLVTLEESQLRHLRWREFSVVMQSAMNALNPVKSLGAQMRDVFQEHGKTSTREIRDRSAEVLRMVGIDPVHLRSYPHQLSGGNAAASDDRHGPTVRAATRHNGRTDVIAGRGGSTVADDPDQASAGTAWLRRRSS